MNPSVIRLESAGYATWSADETSVLGGWAVGSNGGFTRRVNSATVVGDADASLETRDQIAEWFARRGASIAVRLTPLVTPATRSAVHDTWSLAEVDETRVLTRPTAVGPRSEVETVDLYDPDFAAELFAYNDRGPSTAAAFGRLLGRIENGTGLWLPGVVVGIAAIHDHIAMVYSVAVSERERGQGWGTAAMEAASGWAARSGASHLGLQVEGANVPALALYESLGFEEIYRYSYLQPVPDDTHADDT
ncbi:MAG: GNAT family N-acetyltransferase [Acidimicrobiia bacterium]